MGAFRGGLVAVVLLSIAGCSSSNSANPAASSLELITVYEPGPGIVMPTVLREVKPTYTSAAIQNRIQGSVLLSVVVLSDGTVADVTVVRSLDTTFGLDAQAVSAARQWLFRPGTRNGQPVAVRVAVEMTFSLA